MVRGTYIPIIIYQYVFHCFSQVQSSGIKRTGTSSKFDNGHVVSMFTFSEDSGQFQHCFETFWNCSILHHLHLKGVARAQIRRYHNLYGLTSLTRHLTARYRQDSERKHEKTHTSFRRVFTTTIASLTIWKYCEDIQGISRHLGSNGLQVDLDFSWSSLCQNASEKILGRNKWIKTIPFWENCCRLKICEGLAWPLKTSPTGSFRRLHLTNWRVSPTSPNLLQSVWYERACAILNHGTRGHSLQESVQTIILLKTMSLSCTVQTRHRRCTDNCGRNSIFWKMKESWMTE